MKKTEKLFMEWLEEETADSVLDGEVVESYEIRYVVNSYIGSIETTLKSALKLDDEELGKVIVVVNYECGEWDNSPKFYNFKKFALEHGMTEEELFYCE